MKNTAILELNDSGLCCATGPDDLMVIPGYALLTDSGITTGRAAQEQAYLDPRQSFNQYWHQLNLSPLPVSSRVARHHADLAYAQLLQLHRDLGHPEQVIFAAPGSFDREQLAILLGLAKASPFEAVGLVDAAVAAASQAGLTVPALHLDIQLHQTVVTRLRYSDGEVERATVDILPELGFKTFYDLWAQLIADQFIRQYRFDPLHTAAGEQQLYNNLPEWLAQLCRETEVAVALDSAQGNYRISLSRNQLLASSAPRSKQLQQRLTELSAAGEILLASHRIALLPGLVEHLKPSRVLSASSAIDGCLQHLERISARGDLPFVTRLPTRGDMSSGSAPATATPDAPPVRQPTHLLYRHRAHAIGDGLTVAETSGGLTFNDNGDLLCELIPTDGQLQLESANPRVRCSGDRGKLTAGDRILIGDEQLELIEVA